MQRSILAGEEHVLKIDFARNQHLKNAHDSTVSSSTPYLNVSPSNSGSEAPHFILVSIDRRQLSIFHIVFDKFYPVETSFPVVCIQNVVEFHLHLR